MLFTKNTSKAKHYINHLCTKQQKAAQQPIKMMVIYYCITTDNISSNYNNYKRTMKMNKNMKKNIIYDELLKKTECAITQMRMTAIIMTKCRVKVNTHRVVMTM